MRIRWLAVVGCAVVLSAGEAAAQRQGPPSFVEGRCSNYRVTPTEATVPVRGGSGRFRVRWDWEAPPSGGECAFACTSNACGEVTGGVTVTSGADWLEATKEGVWVNYTADGNTGTTRRRATVTIIGQTFTVRQGPCPPSPSVTPNPRTFGHGGGAGDLTVNAPASCVYAVSDNRNWIGATPGSVSGGERVRVSVTANGSTNSRSGRVRVGNRNVTIRQDGVPCPATPSVSSSSRSFGSGGGSRTVTVRESSACSYSVTDDRTWISVSPASVSGNGTVTITATATGTTSSRSGTVRIGGRRVSVSQSGIPCPTTPSVSSSSRSFGSGGGSRTVTLQEPSACSYSVTADGSWITVSPSSVSGNGTVTIAATANESTSSRSGTVRIGSRSVSVSQAGITCSTTPSVSSSSLSFGNVSDSQTVTVQEPAVCSYSVTADGTWITVSPSSVAGNGTVTVTAMANTGTSARSGTVRIGSGSVAITQIAPLTLTQHRDRLIADWATRKGHDSACRAWNSLEPDGKGVFIWNTHRLFISTMGSSNMLDHVTKLYSVTGRKDKQSCGGEGFNRTFMSMTPELQEMLLRTVAKQQALPEWRESHDPACWLGGLEAFTNCPHPPFWFQAETRSDGPTGQIQFFDAELVVVDRDHYYGLGLNPARLVRNCGVSRIRVALADVCATGSCFGDSPVGECHTTTYQDTILIRASDPYRIPVDGQQVTDAYSFEMDQDYSWVRGILPRFHDSAPVDECNDMRNRYVRNYGDPDWNWAPTACEAAHQPGVAFTFDSLASAPVRAVDTVELRARIDGLRQRFGLPAFSWTDATIHVGVTPMKAAHVTDLRTALNEAYVAGGRALPRYVDAVIVAGVTPIKAVHLTELRAAVRALEP